MPSFTHYCITCNTNNCKTSHSNYHKYHSTIGIQQYPQESIPINPDRMIDSIISSRQININHFIQRLKESSLSDKDEMIEKIISLNEKHQQINKDLQYLYNSLIYTCNELINHPIHQIISLFSTVQLNRRQWDLGDDKCNVAISYELLSNSLRNDFILNRIEEYDFKQQLCNNSFVPYITYVTQLTNGLLAFGTANGSINIYNIFENKSIVEIKEHETAVSLLYQIDDDLLASYGKEDIMKIWNLETYKCVKIIFCLGEVTSITSVKDYIITFEKHSQELWKIMIRNKDYKITSVLTIDDWSLIIPIKSNESHNLIAFNAKKKIHIWDLSSNQCLTKIENNADNSLVFLLHLTDGRFIYSMMKDEEPVINVLHTNTYAIQASFNEHNTLVIFMLELKNKELLTCSINSVKFWNMKTLTCVRNLIGFDCKTKLVIRFEEQKICFVVKETKYFHPNYRLIVIELLKKKTSTSFELDTSETNNKEKALQSVIIPQIRSYYCYYLIIFILIILCGLFILLRNQSIND